MSLGKIGKLTNVFNAFKQSPFSNKSDMISSLAAFGNINKAASSQADWTKTAFNLPVTDMQNTVMLAMYQPNISLRHKEVRHGY